MCSRKYKQSTHSTPLVIIMPSKSWVWEHATKYGSTKRKNGEEKINGTEPVDRIYAVCKHCTTHVEIECADSSTGLLTRHLKELHGISDQRNKRRKTSPPSASGSSSGSSAEENAFMRLPATERLAIIWSRSGLAFRLIDDPFFRMHFKKCIPNEVTRHGLANSTIRVGEKWKKELFRNLKNHYVALSLDGYTNASGDKVVNFIVRSRENDYYLSSETIGDKSTDTLKQILLDTINELRKHDIFVTSLVGDNENAVQSAIDAIVAMKPNILGVRCASHTIQLLLKEVEAKIDVVKESIRDMNQILDLHRSSEFRKRLKLQFIENQTPVKLIRPVVTRWSSNIDSMGRILRLRTQINNLLNWPEEKWERISQVHCFLEPFRRATDEMQMKEANIFTIHGCLSKLKQHIDRSDLIFRKKAQALYASRFVSGKFSTRAMHVAEWLSPSLDFAALTKTKQKECFHELTEFVSQAVAERQSKITVENISRDIRDWLYRPVASDGTEIDNSEYWLKNVASFGTVGLAAHKLLTVPPSEASVERSFSQQKIIHSHIRSLLKTDKVEAMMMIRYNCNLFLPLQDV